MIKANVYPSGSHILADVRGIWSRALADLGHADPRVIALNADLSRATFTDQFKQELPDRFFNVGIAEQDMVGICAGLALKGKLPYAVTYAPFAAMRAGEQFRTDCCYQNLPVRLIGMAAGLSPAGATHSGIEDAGIIRTMPNAVVVSASEPKMVEKILNASLSCPNPMYIRLGFGRGEQEIYDGDYDFAIGKAIEARPGKDATLITFGTVLSDALKAAELLAVEGLDIQVIDMPTLKPIDKEAILEAAETTGKIITLEDHNIYGGLGSAVAEVLAEADIPCKFRRLGIPDCFAHFGSLPFLHGTYGYDAAAAVRALRELLA